MSKSKNQHLYDKNQATLERLSEEFRSIGRYVKLEPGHLTVFALAPPKEVKKKVESRRGSTNDGRERTGSQDRPVRKDR